ncbi:MAG: hypothetical protein ACRDYC_01710 [Acidimicrobiales bacterium]
MTSSDAGMFARSIHEQAAVLAAFARAEASLFEILGGWVATTRTTRAKLLLDRHSAHAAWRSEQWRARVPTVPPADALPGLATEPGRWRALGGIDALAELSGDAVRLAGAYRFAFPRLHAAYTEEGLRSSPVADAAVLRTLRQAEDDLQADWLEGELLLQDLMRSETDVEAAGRALIGLERGLMGGGGTH